MYHFWVFGMTRPVIEFQSSGQLANTLPTRKMGRLKREPSSHPRQHIHNHVVLLERISLTLPCHPSLSSIASGWSYRPHPVSAHSCGGKVLAGYPIHARPCAGIQKRTSLMSSSLLLHQCLACLVCRTGMVLVMGGRWRNSCSFVGCFLQDLFIKAYRILVQLLSTFFFLRLVSVHVVHPYSSMDMTVTSKKYIYIYIYIMTAIYLSI